MWSKTCVHGFVISFTMINCVYEFNVPRINENSTLILQSNSKKETQIWSELINEWINIINTYAV